MLEQARSLAALDVNTHETLADDPALIIYTSGTTGEPKGVLHSHRVLRGLITSISFTHRFRSQGNGVAWSPADWSWVAGLFGILLPTLWHGLPVVAYRRSGPYDPEEAIKLINRFQITHMFQTPTMLRMLEECLKDKLTGLTSVLIGGEASSAELYQWCLDYMGVLPNEAYGMTECTPVAINLPYCMKNRPGSLGQPAFGVQLKIINETQSTQKNEGELAIRHDSCAMMMGYWADEAATKAKFKDGWMMTGDYIRIDDEGYLWFLARDTDIIKSSGYKISPAEVEACMLQHPAVSAVGVIGVPDPLRTEIVKAYITLNKEQNSNKDLENELRSFVKNRLGRYLYPREITFLPEIPINANGKIDRKKLRTLKI